MCGVTAIPNPIKPTPTGTLPPYRSDFIDLASRIDRRSLATSRIDSRTQTDCKCGTRLRHRDANAASQRQ
jgi:hypothetical protein